MNGPPPPPPPMGIGISTPPGFPKPPQLPTIGKSTSNNSMVPPSQLPLPMPMPPPSQVGGWYQTNSEFVYNYNKADFFPSLAFFYICSVFYDFFVEFFLNFLFYSLFTSYTCAWMLMRLYTK